MSFILSLFLATSMRFELFPGDDIRVVTLQIEESKGTPVAKMIDNVRKLEEDIYRVLKREEYISVRSWIGKKVTRDKVDIGDNLASIKIEFTDFNQRKRTVGDILVEIQKYIDLYKFKVSLEKVKGGPPVGKDVDIKISGYDRKEIYNYAKKIKYFLDNKEVISTEIDYDPNIKEYIIDIKNKKTESLGLNTSLISAEIRSAFSEDRVSTIIENDEIIDLIIRIDPVYRKNHVLRNLKIPNNTGNYIPLKNVVEISSDRTADKLIRKKYKKTISIGATIDKNKTTSLKINNEIEEFIKNTIDENIFYSLEGENEDTKESLKDFLTAGVLSFFAIFFLLVIMFKSLLQPFIIMTAIPLGIMGVIYTFKIAQVLGDGWSLGFMAIMGVIGLVGVVVNDSIVLVDTINKNIDKDYLNEVIDSSKSRLRAVILTTFTTVMGLLPLVFSPNGDPFLRPMALSFAGGLLFSSLITLIFVPSLYYSILRIKQKIN